MKEYNKMLLSLKKKEKESIESQINHLETKNANIYQRLIELNTIKSLINPNEGITKQYLQYLFKVLSKYVSEYLLLMDANFIIKIRCKYFVLIIFKYSKNY